MPLVSLYLHAAAGSTGLYPLVSELQFARGREKKKLNEERGEQKDGWSRSETKELFGRISPNCPR